MPSPPSAIATLWVLHEGASEELLLIAELDDGRREPPVLARGADDVRAWVAAHGRPRHLASNGWVAIRAARAAEPSLYEVSADVVKPAELASSLVSLLFDASRARASR